MAQKLNQEGFQELIEKESGLILIDFYADWCGPCKMMAPVVEQIAVEYEGKVVVGKINTDEAQKLAFTYNIMSIPTLMLFKGGQPVDMAVGMQSASELRQLIDKNL